MNTKHWLSSVFFVGLEKGSYKLWKFKDLESSMLFMIKQRNTTEIGWKTIWSETRPCSEVFYTKTYAKKDRLGKSSQGTQTVNCHYKQGKVEGQGNERVDDEDD